ncbi:putative membrane protein [Escherichia coli DEC12A]|nr:putative membrane protein [Escherichia coli DEC12A]
MMFYNCVRQLIYLFFIAVLLSFNVTVFLLSVFAWCFMFL